MKFKKFLSSLIFIVAFSISGCEINLYRPDNEVANQEIVTQDTIHKINPSNYNGTINYAPNNQQELTNEEIYIKGLNSTVYIIASSFDTQSLGSGVFFSEDSNDDGYAYLFTNAHVVKNAISIEIVYSNYKRDTATLVGYHLFEDIAVLKVRKNDNYKIPTIQTSDNLEVASRVVTIGTPLSTDYSFSSTSGVLSKINSPINSAIDPTYTLLLLQIDATLNSGNSGGPLFDKYGNLIGINTMKLLYDDKLTPVDDFNFSIPMERTIFIANQIFENIKFNKGTLGVTIIDIIDLPIADRTTKKITLDYGLYVEEVAIESASYNIIQSNDIIVKINNIEFKNKAQFQKELLKHATGETIELTVYRNNEYKTINITLK